MAPSVKKTYKNPHFKEYVDLANFKNYPGLFHDEDEVVITEKIHGTNFRAGWVPFTPNTLWRKFLKLIGWAPEWQFVFGSRRVQISEKFSYDGYYAKNVYAEAVMKYDLKRLIPKGMLVFGEIYGPTIQKGYNYGLKDERCLVVFDLMNSVDGTYLNATEFEAKMAELKLPKVPVLFRGQFQKAPIKMCIEGASVMAPEQKVREGCVIKSVSEEPCYIGRKLLKAINAEYLLSDPTEYH